MVARAPTRVVLIVAAAIAGGVSARSPAQADNYHLRRLLTVEPSGIRVALEHPAVVTVIVAQTSLELALAPRSEAPLPVLRRSLPLHLVATGQPAESALPAAAPGSTWTVLSLTTEAISRLRQVQALVDGSESNFHGLAMHLRAFFTDSKEVSRHAFPLSIWIQPEPERKFRRHLRGPVDLDAVQQIAVP